MVPFPMPLEDRPKFWKRGQWNELRAGSSAIRLKGNAAAFHDNLGVALDDQGKLDEAVARYRRATRL